MNQPTLFPDEPELPPDLDEATTEILDAMDKWQTLLSAEDWATVRKSVDKTFKVTTMVEKPKPKEAR